MNILITGGTGYIGTVLVEESVKAGHNTYVLTRNREKSEALEKQGVKVIVGDILQDGQWQQKINDMDAVIHLAAPPTWGKKVTKKVALSYADGHLELTKRLFAAIDPKHLKRLIFVGGTSYFGDSGNEAPRTESFQAEPKGWGPYISPSIKYAKEKIAEGYPASIVFPAQIYGPSSWMEQLFFQPLYTNKPITSLKGYSPYFSPIHIEDCARALLHLIEKGEIGEDYIISDLQPLKSTVFRDEIIKLMGVRNPKFREVPRWLCQLLLGPVLTEYATAHTNFSSKKLQETGFKFRYPTYIEGLPQVVDAWLKLQS
ncbi:NAD-dependent epimerase/dehydratase family protein [Cohnella abietis]|uniref:Dihydroflavonol-4-reductase n=1 Tax=Cohnella abietis TaxID=2507935 RepID=A0A3T1CYT1_9BACL|nr:NAD(P)-dependent oxidoreductase [Cohnella abietis]BBI30905.1 dihydroflavonol-4-reductase [Cohnella abietis]